MNKFVREVSGLKWHVLYKDEKGKQGWLESGDPSVWKPGALKVINKKLCEIVAVYEVSA